MEREAGLSAKSCLLSLVKQVWESLELSFCTKLPGITLERNKVKHKATV